VRGRNLLLSPFPSNLCRIIEICKRSKVSKLSSEQKDNLLHDSQRSGQWWQWQGPGWAQPHSEASDGQTVRSGERVSAKATHLLHSMAVTNSLLSVTSSTAVSMRNGFVPPPLHSLRFSTRDQRRSSRRGRQSTGHPCRQHEQTGGPNASPSRPWQGIERTLGHSIHLRSHCCWWRG
jgi:hypothetical protein